MSKIFNEFKQRLYNICSLGQRYNVRFLDQSGNAVTGIENAQKFFVSPAPNDEIDDPARAKQGFVLDFKNIGEEDQGIDIYLIGDMNVQDFQKLNSAIGRECGRFNMTTHHVNKERQPKLGAFLNTKPEDENMTRESREMSKTKVEEGLTGSSMRSYQDIGNCRVIVHHSVPVGDYAGARTRHIDSVFMENSQGERFRWPHTNIAGARAATRLLSEGFAWSGPKIRLIRNLSESFDHLRAILAATRTVTEGNGLKIRENVRSTAQAIKEHFGKIAGNRAFQESLSECERLMANRVLNEDETALQGLRTELQLSEDFNKAALSTVMAFGCNRIDEKDELGPVQQALAVDHGVEKQAGEGDIVTPMEKKEETWLEKLTNLQKLTHAGTDVSPASIRRQAERMDKGEVRLSPARSVPPMFAKNPEGKQQMVIWKVQDMAERLPRSDSLLSSLLSRYAEARTEKLNGRKTTFDINNKDMVALLTWAAKNLIKGPAMASESIQDMESQLNEWANQYTYESLLAQSARRRDEVREGQRELIRKAVGILSEDDVKELSFQIVEAWRAKNKKSAAKITEGLGPLGKRQVRHYIEENWNFRVNGVILESLAGEELIEAPEGASNAAVVDASDPMCPKVKAFVYGVDSEAADVSFNLPHGFEVFYTPVKPEDEVEFDDNHMVPNDPWFDDEEADKDLVHIVDKEPGVEPVDLPDEHGMHGPDFGDELPPTEALGHESGMGEEPGFMEPTGSGELDLDEPHSAFESRIFEEIKKIKGRYLGELSADGPVDIGTNMVKSWKSQLGGSHPNHAHNSQMDGFEDAISSDPVLKSEFERDPKAAWEVWSREEA